MAPFWACLPPCLQQKLSGVEQGAAGKVCGAALTLSLPGTTHAGHLRSCWVRAGTGCL